MTVAGSTEKAYTQTEWDLSQLFSGTDDPQIDEALGSLEESVSELESRRDALDQASGGELRDTLQLYERIIEKMTVLGAFAGLRFSADTQDGEALSLRNRVEHELTAFENRVLFLPLWWKALSESRAKKLSEGADLDHDLSFYLEHQRRLRQYSVDEAAEQLINTKDADGVGGLLTLHSMLTNRLSFTLRVDGEAKELTRDELMVHVASPRADLRQQSYQELGRVLEREAQVLSQIYSHRVRDWHNENVNLRGYASPLAVRNVANDVPDAAVTALLETAERNTGVFHRYFRLKASWLGSVIGGHKVRDSGCVVALLVSSSSRRDRCRRRM